MKKKARRIQLVFNEFEEAVKLEDCLRDRRTPAIFRSSNCVSMLPLAAGEH
jgi:hypothetical protein